MRYDFLAEVGVVLAVSLYCTSSPAYVLPQLGGGQLGLASAPMKHADVALVDGSIVVHLDATVPTPQLRALVAPDEFDPAAAWSVLQNKAYNFQYGWNPSGFWAPPAGTGVWVEQLSASPGLEAYFVDGLPVSPPYDPIFGTAGSSLRWKWSGVMTHNAYAVMNPTKDSYQATYKVYIGDEITGDEVAEYGSAEVTFDFVATPVLTADFNDDRFVDAADLLVWQQSYGMIGAAHHSDGDADTDADIDGLDFLAWQRQFSPVASGGQLNSATGVPEPSAVVLTLSVLLLLQIHRRSWRQ